MLSEAFQKPRQIRLQQVGFGKKLNKKVCKQIGWITIFYLFIK
jgi:hypothetical protein